VARRKEAKGGIKVSLQISQLAAQPETIHTFAERCALAMCRCCGKEGLSPVINLGEMPIADALLDRPDPAEPLYPLEVAFCRGCALVQILETLPPEQLFGAAYPCYSSYSQAVVDHAARSAEQLIRAHGLKAQSKVIELGSNDGCMLRNFIAAGIPSLGIDPAPGPAAAAEAAGIPTRCEFFSRSLAEQLAGEGHRADLIVANNVLNKAADVNDFVAGMARLLRSGSAAVIEVPYVRDLISRGEFGAIYHEQTCYFSATSARTLFRRHGLFLNRVEHIALHGGSLRMTVEPRERVEGSVKELIAAEAREGVAQPQYYRRFGETIRHILAELRSIFRSVKTSGATLAAYGASADGAILLNALGVGDETIDFVADRNPHKQGKYLPGVHIPIVAPETLLERQPDYTLLLAWNFKDEVLNQQAAYRERGGQFIIPIPTPRIV
jgi:SAM-dependent methyltransferase